MDYTFERQLMLEREEKEEDVLRLYETVCLFMPECDEDKVRAFEIERNMQMMFKLMDEGDNEGRRDNQGFTEGLI